MICVMHLKLHLFYDMAMLLPMSIIQLNEDK